MKHNEKAAKLKPIQKKKKKKNPKKRNRQFKKKKKKKIKNFLIQTVTANCSSNESRVM